MNRLEPAPMLAPAYQLALDLEAEGLGAAELAERLGMPEASIPALLEVAHAKAAGVHDTARAPREETP